MSFGRKFSIEARAPKTRDRRENSLAKCRQTQETHPHFCVLSEHTDKRITLVLTTITPQSQTCSIELDFSVDYRNILFNQFPLYSINLLLKLSTVFCILLMTFFYSSLIEAILRPKGRKVTKGTRRNYTILYVVHNVYKGSH